MLRKLFYYSAIIILMFGIQACSSEPEPIVYGEDNCAECRMLATDKKFGAELITEKGKIYKFDAVECLISFYNKSDLKNSNNLKMYVVDFSNPSKLIDVSKSYFLKNDLFHSPMSLNVLAFENKDSLMKIKNKYEGEEISWQKLLSNTDLH